MNKKYRIIMNYHFDVIGRRGELSSRNIDLWKRDFEFLKKCGFNGVISNVVLWSDGESGISGYEPVDVQKKFLDVCAESGLNVMLSPMLMKIPSIARRLPDEKQFLATGIRGNRLDLPDIFSRNYRRIYLEKFLREIIIAFGTHPAVCAYCFGDNFVGMESGFSEENRMEFIRFLKEKYGNISLLNKTYNSNYRGFSGIRLPGCKCPWTPLWQDFTSARKTWLVDYIEDTNRIIREYDKDKSRRIPFAAMSWDLFTDKNAFGGISREFLDACDVALTSQNFPEEYYPESLALTLTEWCFSAIRKACPEKEIGTADIPGPRNRRWSGADRFPSSKRIVKLLEKTLEYRANWFVMDGYRKSLQQTAVANRQVYAFHRKELSFLGGFFKNLK